MTKSKAPTTAIKSQLESLSGKVPSAAPQSHLARFIAGELKGGEVKHNYAMSVIRSAIEQAFKGNTRDIPEAVRLCEGKAIKAKAYCAGFHAIADMVAPVSYVGKFDSKDNAPVREVVAQCTETAMLAFEVAYLDVFACAKVEAADKKAKKSAEAKTAPATESAPVAGAEQVISVDTEVIDIADMVSTLVSAISTGMLDDAELAAIRAALDGVTVQAPVLQAA